jgi:hypothetical protein
MRTLVRAHLVALGVLAGLALVPFAYAGGEKPKQKDIDPQEGKTVTIKAKLTDKDGTDSKREGCFCKTYPINLVKGTRYVIIMRSNDVDSYLRLEDGANQVAEDDDSGKGDTGLDAMIEYTPDKTGKFKLIATTFAANTTGDFVLTIQREKGAGGGGEGGADLKVIRGELTAKDSFDKVRQQMYCKIYPVKLLAGNTYQIDMKSTDLDSYLRLEDPDGNQIAEDDDGGGFPNARIRQDINKTGTYKIIATSFGANSTGKFVVEIRGKGVGEATGTERVGGDGDGGSKTIKGKLANNDPEYAGRKGSFHKAYTHKLVQGHTYTIDLTSTDIDSYLYLENPEGKVVAEDDDGGGFPNARITYKAPTTGNYKLIATSFKAGETGDFTLSIKDAGGPGGGGEKEAKQEKGVTPLKLGVVTKSKLDNNDKGYKNRNNHLHKVFSLKMESGKTYVITMRSDDFDSYLFLEDGAAKVLEQDDDTGGGNTGLDAQITFNCTKDGTYRIITTTFGPNMMGNFTLEVQKQK